MVYTGEGGPPPPTNSQQGRPTEQGPHSAGPEHPGSPDLRFPDLPRLELDALLGQLVERAQEVMATQGRLRGLLRANQMVTGDLTLPVLLRRIVGAARDLMGARDRPRPRLRS